MCIRDRRDAVPEITGYGYYMPEAEGGLVQGERAANVWVKTQGAQTITGELAETWYYFDENGLTPRGSKGKLAFMEIDGSQYAFNYLGRTVDVYKRQAGRWSVGRSLSWFIGKWDGTRTAGTKYLATAFSLRARRSMCLI